MGNFTDRFDGAVFEQGHSMTPQSIHFQNRIEQTLKLAAPFFWCCCLSYCTGGLFGQTAIEASDRLPSLQESKNQPANASDDFNQLVTQLVLDGIPHTFTEAKDWGGQKERFDGFKRSRNGLRFNIETRKKLVNHGTWKKYDVSLRNPKSEFAVSINNMRELADDRIRFDIDVGAHLNVSGRQSKWVKGVQLYSLSARGHAKLKLHLAVELVTTTDAKSFPPDLVFTPTVKTADITLEEFRIDRVGKAGGEFAQQVSKKIRPILESKIAEKEKGLAKKLNAKIAKKQDRLRLPIADALGSKWSTAAKTFLTKQTPKPRRSPLKD